MTKPLSAQSVEEQARKLLDARMASVRALVELQTTIASLHEQLSNAHDTHARAFREATNAGWSPRELLSLGISEPVKTKARRAPAKARQRTAPAAKGAQSTTRETEVDLREGAEVS